MADASSTVPAFPDEVGKQWPDLTTLQFYEVLFAPIFFTILLSVALHYWPVKELPPKPKQSETTPLNGDASIKIRNLDAGEVAGDYSAPWTKTFDLVFLIGMIAAFALLALITSWYKPELWSNGTFWLYQTPKIAVMIGLSVICGLICRNFCDVDADGYIMTNKHSVFKVNYTRKVQHLAAYLVPLVIPVPESCHCKGTLETAWGQWFTLLCFLCMIKPVRERMSLFMLQFNSMDRPEDRPHTLKWIIAGNIIWGEALILFFRNLYEPYGQEELAFIFIYITGLGDGLAEPVGIWFGRHKYAVRSCAGGRAYTRSYEGSACVFLSGMIFTSIYYFAFNSATQFWTIFFVMAPIMTIAEATSPHTMDTPFMMGLGGILLYAAIRLL